jgi:hypothetical protein
VVYIIYLSCTNFKNPYRSLNSTFLYVLGVNLSVKEGQIRVVRNAGDIDRTIGL